MNADLPLIARERVGKREREIEGEGERGIKWREREQREATRMSQ